MNYLDFYTCIYYEFRQVPKDWLSCHTLWL